MIQNYLYDFVEIKVSRGLYQINRAGQVKRVQSIVSHNRHGHSGVQTVRERILKTNILKIGYKSVNICVDGKPKLFYLHRLLAETFIPNPENKREINHIDGDKLNCDLSNLEWVTSGENKEHAYRTGLKVNKKGKDSPMYGMFKGAKSPHFGKRRGECANAKIVLDMETGIFYDSAIDAAEVKNYSVAHFREMLNGKVGNKTKMMYV